MQSTKMTSNDKDHAILLNKLNCNYLELKSTKLLTGEKEKNWGMKKGQCKWHALISDPRLVENLISPRNLEQLNANKQYELNESVTTLESINSIRQCGSGQNQQQQQSDGERSKQCTTTRQDNQQYVSAGPDRNSSLGSGGGDKDDEDNRKEDQNSHPRDAPPPIAHTQKPKRNKKKKHRKRMHVSRHLHRFSKVRRRFPKCCRYLHVRSGFRPHFYRSRKHSKSPDDYHSVLPFPTGSQATSVEGECSHKPRSRKISQRLHCRHTTRRAPQAHNPPFAKVTPVHGQAKPSTATSSSKHHLTINAELEKNKAEEGALAVGDQTFNRAKNPYLVPGISPNIVQKSEKKVNLPTNDLSEQKVPSTFHERESDSSYDVRHEHTSTHPYGPNSIMLVGQCPANATHSETVTGTYTDPVSQPSECDTIRTQTSEPNSTSSDDEVFSGEQPIVDDPAAATSDTMVVVPVSVPCAGTSPPQHFSVPQEETRQRKTSKIITRNQSLSRIDEIREPEPERQTSPVVTPQTPLRPLSDYPPDWTEATQTVDTYPINRLCLLVNSREYRFSPPHAQAVSDVHARTQEQRRSLLTTHTQYTRINRQVDESDFVITGTLVEISPFDFHANNIALDYQQDSLFVYLRPPQFPEEYITNVMSQR